MQALLGLTKDLDTELSRKPLKYFKQGGDFTGDFVALQKNRSR